MLDEDNGITGKINITQFSEEQCYRYGWSGRDTWKNWAKVRIISSPYRYTHDD